MLNKDKVCQLAVAVIATERDSVAALLNRVDANFVQACELLLACKGRIIVSGIGKSGHIGKKIAATFASTGSPAFFIHPAEASHGDLGMITPDDVIIFISNSGESAEVLSILPTIKMLGIRIISLTGDASSTLAQNADINLDISVETEACPLKLAPTSSTTVSLVMGDALAIAMLDSKGFSKEDFALSHPGGSLGKKLLQTAYKLMHQGDDMPVVKQTANLKETLAEMSAKKLGHTLIVNQAGELAGIFTDGDVRRSFEKGYDLDTPIQKIVKKPCCSISHDMLATEALRKMEERKITAIPIVDANNCPIGLLHLHDILRAGMIEVS